MSEENILPDLPPGKILCTKCGKVKEEKKDFFMKKDRTRLPICKTCLTTFIDNTDPESFKWILKEFDIPYMASQWIPIYNKVKKEKGYVPQAAVLGVYIRTMNMIQFRNYGYDDTEAIAEREAGLEEFSSAKMAQRDEEQAKRELEFLQDQLNKGNISEAEFQTRNPFTQIAENPGLEFDMSEPPPPEPTEDDLILEQLEEEEISLLKRKWGEAYKPTQWIRMEDTYNKYANEFELNVDREESLKQICKLTVKMDEALEIGDVNGYRQLSTTHDSLRKSAKFTDSQKEKDSTRYIDTIGELVLMAEKEGGIIPQIPNPDDTPQDNVDFAIKDMKAYYYNLVSNELGLGDLIESYIKKLEENDKNKEESLDDGFILSSEEQAMEEIEAEEDARIAQEFSDFLSKEMDDEIDKLLGDDL